MGASVGSDPWTSSEVLPWGPYSAPDPQLSRAITFACQHRHHCKPNKLLVVVVWKGGHMKLLQTERGDQQFFCCFQGGIKSLTESFIPFLPPLPSREVKNDNSLSFRDSRGILDSWDLGYSDLKFFKLIRDWVENQRGNVWYWDIHLRH